MYLCFSFSKEILFTGFEYFSDAFRKNHNLSNDKKDIQSKHQGKGSVDIYSGSLKFDH